MKLYSSEMDNQQIIVFTCRDAVVLDHEHDFFELAYIQQGNATHHLENNVTTLHEGDYFIIDYGQHHYYEQVGDVPLVVINCLFLPRLISEDLQFCRSFKLLLEHYLFQIEYQTLQHSPTEHIFHDTDKKIEKLLLEMQREHESQNIGRIEIMRCNLINILIHSIRELYHPFAHTRSDMTQHIISYVQEHFSEKLSLEKIAADYRYSLGFVSKKFKAETGISFQEYVQEVRIKKSCHLLISTKKKTTEIADLVGYSDMKFFCNIFKRKSGITPSEYRKRYTR